HLCLLALMAVYFTENRISWVYVQSLVTQHTTDPVGAGLLAIDPMRSCWKAVSMPSRASPLPQFLTRIKKAAVKQRPRKTFIKELQINVRVNRWAESMRLDALGVCPCWNVRQE
ncbi:hypothetical protein CJU78_24330, partial [Pseudomonas fragi]